MNNKLRRDGKSVRLLHSFQLPCFAQDVLYIRDEAELKTLAWRDDFLFLGEGTNTLFVDDFGGTVVVNALKGVNIEEDEESWSVSVGAGENWHELVLNLLDKAIFGLENLVLIPGSVGASPVQNIGAYGVEVGTFIDSVEVWDFEQQAFRTLNQQACEFAYRDSVFKRESSRKLFITRVNFSFPKAWEPVLTYGPLADLGSNATAKAIADKVIEVRQSKLPDPAVLPNAGSFFKNPVVSAHDAEQLKAKYADLPVYETSQPEKVKLAAGWLIEACGLKGFCLKGACVHDKQALVLVNKGEAEAKHVLALAKAVQTQVLEKFGVNISPEVRLIGAQGERGLYE
ncbi:MULTISPECIES: UDP-N-acetylmuramate dehydrogenase [Gammaproteobacteria]|uniref:UDP-N-acetylmuramate dehydrogenase n=1 Tax=Gammaproteobacteria TaxID=1236 RepID=UPI000DCFFB7D|nr:MULTISPECIES: UDP-N-acetylmuramate dehydrogenase [Gammaproteobacteria]RTE87756.1 UDP-N-acetylmuramate dehydrogenase [Aliidiomarina sp. B3213]TCZ92462.1 UDP-N-acetylmuramate dehydrogenase [Lysobacter sp. N42]